MVGHELYSIHSLFQGVDLTKAAQNVGKGHMKVSTKLEWPKNTSWGRGGHFTCSDKCARFFSTKGF